MGTILNHSAELTESMFKLSFRDGIRLEKKTSGKMHLFDEAVDLLEIKGLTSIVSNCLMLLNERNLSKNDLKNKAFGNANYMELSLLIYSLEKLEMAGYLTYTTFCDDSPFCSYEDMTNIASFEFDIHKKGRFKLSKFSYLRLENDGYLIESSLGTSRVKIFSPLAFSILGHLSVFKTIEELIETETCNPDALIAFITALNAGNYLEYEQINDTTHINELWNFHDLLFHTRTRYGRHNYKLGATYRFIGKRAPKKAIQHTAPAVAAISLSRPENQIPLLVNTLTECMEKRASVRSFSGFDATSLGIFLFRCLRIKDRMEYAVKNEFDESDHMELLKAPYPSGGSIYELNFYITINDCNGLQPGFYHYNTFEHKLSLLQAGNNTTNSLLWYAKAAMGGSETPPVLITLVADFERMFWKYENMAYATILKNVGAVYQTMYLVAADMGIGGCALGNGNIELIQRLTKKSFLAESSVGEFVIGKPLHNTN